MSSATSTEAVRLKTDSVRAEASDDAGFRPWHFFILAALAASTVAVLMSRQSTPEHLILISVTIAAAGGAAAAFYRMLAPFALQDVSVLDDPPSERARAAIEREKALVLRSIKELEFDRAMGKVSPKDFDEMAGRLRARAVMLMKQLDEGGSGYRELIERELKTRLKTAGRAGSSDPANDARAQTGRAGSLDPATDPATETRSEVAARSEDRALPAETCTCGTVNDLDAAFCKRCGTRLQAVHS